MSWTPGRPQGLAPGCDVERVKGPGTQMSLGIVTEMGLESREPAEFRARIKKE